MKRIFKSKYSLLIASLLIANFFSIVGGNIFGLLSILFFITVPGYLLLGTVIPINKIQNNALKIILSVSLGIFIIYVIGLTLSLLNFGDAPIRHLSVIIGLNLTTLLLAYTSKFSNPKKPYTVLSAKSVYVYSFLIALPIISSLGAIRLNNGAPPTLTLTALLLIGITFATGLIYSKKFKHYYIPAIYSFSLSVLLATSLRGYGIIGHDIQNEFLVFTETLNTARWTLDVLPSAYNACLSITVLPSALVSISDLDPTLLFKFVYQFIFALVPVGVFILAKNVISSRQAFMAAFIFISFPTFINDMPMLLRQEIALLFFVSLLLVAFIDLSRRSKGILSILFMLGIILSHYSTAYITIGMLFVALAIFYLIKILHHSKQKFDTPLLNPLFIVIAGLFLFVWNVQTTNISSGLVGTFTDSVKSILIGVDNESGDVAYSIFGRNTDTSTNAIARYIEENGIEGVTFVPQPKTPLTSIGQFINGNMDVGEIHQYTRKIITYSLQILFFVGLIIMLIINRRKFDIRSTYLIAICTVLALFLALMTILPQVSVNYGVLRLFQQALVVISIPITVAIITLLAPINRYKYVVSATFLALMFLHLSGFLPAITGGFPGQLNTHNSGLYYDAYMTHGSDINGAKWLNNSSCKSKHIYSDIFVANSINIPGNCLGLRNPITYKRGDGALLFLTSRNIDNTLFIFRINSNLYYYSISNDYKLDNKPYSNIDNEIYGQYFVYD